MSKNHALFFVWDGPREESSGSRIMECFNAFDGYWKAKKTAGDIEGYDTVLLSSTRNEQMPVGFMLVTGDRAKLQGFRWDDEEFLNIHTMMMMSFRGYACIDGYTGVGLEKHMERLNKLMQK
jgi:hypothetical protein